MRRILKSRVLAMVVLAAVAFTSVQCGYILYPERRGQKPEGELDMPVLIIDGLLLFIGLIPGIICLFIDYTQGTMYLPKGPVKARPKTSFLFRLQNPAPEDVNLAITLDDPSGMMVVATLMNRDLAQGESLGQVKLRFPDQVAPGSYKLDVRVNGEISQSVDVRF